MAGVDGQDTMDAGAEHPGSNLHDITGLRMMRTSPLLEEAWRYWSSLRSGRDLPRRDALDPRAMRFILGHSMILDRVRPGTVRVRLGGRVMHDLMGMEVRGLPIRAFFQLDDRSRVMPLIDEVFDAPAKLELDLFSTGATGDDVLTGRMLVLPLHDSGGRVTKALTCMALNHNPLEAPHRFAITGHRVTPLGRANVAPVVASERSDFPQRRVSDPQPMELAEAQTPFESRPSGVPWLRVVK
ncbi:MAG: PAS domain-containing protein [Pseudomonadota bacterium]